MAGGGFVSIIFFVLNFFKNKTPFCTPLVRTYPVCLIGLKKLQQQTYPVLIFFYYCLTDIQFIHLSKIYQK